MDAGCGPLGHIGNYLYGLGHEVQGVDISKECISLASSFIPEMNFTQMDMSQMDFEDDTFDGLVAYYSIIHTPKKYIHLFFKELLSNFKSKWKNLIIG